MIEPLSWATFGLVLIAFAKICVGLIIVGALGALLMHLTGDRVDEVLGLEEHEDDNS